MTAFPFTFRQLEVFLTVCDMQSFARAADALDISEAGVSSQIRSLEERLGCPLFERQRGKVNALSQSGEKFRAGIMQVRQDLNFLVRSLTHQSDETFPVRIFIGNHLFQDCIRPNIADFHFENKDITFDFVDYSSHENAINAFDKGELDFIVISVSKDFTHKRMVDICDLTMSIFAIAPLEERARASGLSSIPYIMPPMDSEGDRTTIRQLKAVGVESINVAGRYHHHDIGVQMAIKGAGAIATVSTVARHSDPAGLLKIVADIALYKRVIFVRETLPQHVRDRVTRFVIKHTKLDPD